MRILVDLYKLKEPHSGLGQYSLQLVESLVNTKFYQENEFTFLAPTKSIPLLPSVQILPANNIRRWFSFMNRGFNLWHSTYQTAAFLPARGTPRLLTIHDLNFLYEKSEDKQKNYLRALQTQVDQSDAISCISNFTKGEISKYLNTGNKPVYMIPNGVKWKEFPESRAPKGFSQQNYLYSIGIYSAKKNFKLLAEMMRFLPNHSLVLSGRHDNDYGNQLKSLIIQSGLQNRVSLTGVVTDAEKYWLMKHMDALVFPSTAEGFGLPVIEAMNCGKPVFLSRMGALPETGGEAAFYFDDLDPENMASQVLKGLEIFKNNTEFWVEKIHNKAFEYRWEKSILQYIELYQQML